MGNVGADIHGEAALIKHVEILAKALPAPVDAFMQRGAGNILDPFHQFDQAILAAGPDRREADAAIAHHDRCHPVIAGRGELTVPCCLSVKMGVHIDKARRDEQAGRIDHRLITLGGQVWPNLRDHPTRKPDVRANRLTALAIRQKTAANEGAGHVQSLKSAMTRNSTLERGAITSPGSGLTNAPWMQPTGASGFVSQPLKMTTSSCVICE